MRTRQDINQAYNRPSSAKVSAWDKIEERAKATAGYENNLSIVGASSHFFSCIYSVIEDGVRYIIKDTHTNTYRVREA